MRHVKTNRSLGEANNIRLYDKCSADSRTLPVNCRYFKGNSHSIYLCRIYLMPRLMPNSVQVYDMFSLTSLSPASFTFAFRCKPGIRVTICGFVVHLSWPTELYYLFVTFVLLIDRK